jgi:hypothetical protein
MIESQTGTGGLSQKFESQVERAPTFPFIAGALGSIALSAGFMLTGRKEIATFVGQWVPTLLLIGIYNKVVALSHEHAQQMSAGSAGVH